MRILFQIAIALLSVVAIMNVMRRKNEKLLGPLGAFFWILFWVAVAGIVSLPTNFLDRVSQGIGIGRGVDLVMYVAIALLFFLLFKLYIKIEMLKRSLIEVARKNTFEREKKD